MTEGIIIAIITAVGVVLAALITGICSLIKKTNKATSNIEIKQVQKGKHNSQTGIQNNYKRENDNNERKD